tara:strand:- start:110 stop:523 length:414 start_codon:yes stop_codon:yes gene_type:complete
MFFKKDHNKDQNKSLAKVAALLIHAARIDQSYSKHEEEIIKKTLLNLGASDENIKIIIEDGKKIETNSNQILEFTKEVKNMDNEEKFKIIESLWRIIYSNQEADIYETNLMRRLAGLLYIDSKTMGDIKSKIKNEYL